MNDQNQTTTNTSEPKLCKMGCGFFGSNATGDCCSKCWNSQQKQGATTAAAPVPIAQPPAPLAQSLIQTSAPTPMICEPVKETPVAIAAANAEMPKKKKKKKTSYKNMLAGMMEGSGPRDVEKEKESIARVTGGGNFSKIDKI